MYTQLVTPGQGPRRTPLNDWHRANDGKLVEFAGWSMPVQYSTGSISEHRLVRRSAGLFDVSHMGQVVFRGPGAKTYLDHLVSSDVSTLSENESTYGLLCREDGGVIDDVFVYRFADQWLVVVNASNVEGDLRWFADHLPSSGVELQDESARFAMLALQGPKALSVLAGLCDVGSLRRFEAARADIGGVECIIGRTGYTGEDGVEIFLSTQNAVGIWELILAEADSRDIECAPIGLAARDSLRFEPGFPLYGHELTEEISPIQARLKWACNLDKDFIGAQVLRSQADNGVATKLATVRLADRGVPRQGQAIFHGADRVGQVASGLYAPTIDAYCANVFVYSNLARTGTELDVAIREKRKRAIVVDRPLYKPAYR